MFNLNLPTVIDSAAAESLKVSLLGQMGSHTPCRIDGGRVERIGTAGLQVLWSARLSFAAQGLEFDITPLSPALTQALAMAGLDGPEHFNLLKEPH
nr:STAS domain-containing protein [Asticcacaulis sp. AC402]